MFRKVALSAGQWWDKLEIKNSIKTAIAAVLSFYLALELNSWIQRPDYLAGGLWSTVAAIVVLQSNLGATYKAIFNRFLGVFIGSGIGALFAALFGASGLILGWAILATMLACSLLNLKEGYRISSLSAAVIIIPWSLHPDLSPWLFAFFRFLDTCLGLLIAAVIAYSIWPIQAVTKMRMTSVNILYSLRLLYEHLFIRSEHMENKEEATQDLIDEINSLFSQVRVSLEESRLELFFKSSFILTWTNLINELEKIFDHIISLQSVFDAKLEEMFDEELKRQIYATLEAADNALKEIAAKINRDGIKFSSEPLILLKQNLNSQMLRFRQTRITKQYSLSLVESYFVLVYNLRALMDGLIHLSQLSDHVEDENHDHD